MRSLTAHPEVWPDCSWPEPSGEGLAAKVYTNEWVMWNALWPTPGSAASSDQTCHYRELFGVFLRKSLTGQMRNRAE